MNTEHKSPLTLEYKNPYLFAEYKSLLISHIFFCQIGKAQGFDKKHMKSAQPEVCVKMKNLENGTEFIWPKEKFLNRLYLMKEMYNNYEDEDDWDLPEEKDPFQARKYRIYILLKFIYSEKATKCCEIFT